MPAEQSARGSTLVTRINDTASQDAEKWLWEAVKGRTNKLGPEHPRILNSLKNLIELYEAWDKPEKAEEWRAELPQTETVEQ